MKALLLTFAVGTALAAASGITHAPIDPLAPARAAATAQECSECVELRAALDACRAEREAAKSSAAVATARAGAADDEIERLRGKLTALRDELETSETAVRAQRRQATIAEERVAELEMQLAEARQQAADLVAATEKMLADRSVRSRGADPAVQPRGGNPFDVVFKTIDQVNASAQRTIDTTKQTTADIDDLMRRIKGKGK